MTGTRKYGLLKNDINNIVSVLISNPKIEEIVLFGSRAKGSNRAGSDIDLAIKGENLNLDDLLIAKIQIDKLSLPYKFDIVIYHKITEEELINHINRVGITLHKI
jgi:predicted nucleotidyltransferase